MNIISLTNLFAGYASRIDTISHEGFYIVRGLIETQHLDNVGLGGVGQFFNHLTDSQQLILCQTVGLKIKQDTVRSKFLSPENQIHLNSQHSNGLWELIKSNPMKTFRHS